MGKHVKRFATRWNKQVIYNQVKKYVVYHTVFKVKMKCELVIRLASCVVCKLSLKTFLKEAEKSIWTGRRLRTSWAVGLRPGLERGPPYFLLSHPHAFYFLILPVMLATALGSTGLRALSGSHVGSSWVPTIKLTVPLPSCLSVSSPREWVLNLFICVSCIDLIM